MCATKSKDRHQKVFCESWLFVMVPVFFRIRLPFFAHPLLAATVDDNGRRCRYPPSSLCRRRQRRRGNTESPASHRYVSGSVTGKFPTTSVDNVSGDASATCRQLRRWRHSPDEGPASPTSAVAATTAGDDNGRRRRSPSPPGGGVREMHARSLVDFRTVRKSAT